MENISRGVKVFTQAIVKTPCRNMVNGITSSDLGGVDYDLALKQHGAYIRALEDCGLKVTVLEADEEFPDSTFIEDVCLLTPRCAIITNPGAASRRDEIHQITEIVVKIGLPIEKIHNPGTVDGGDVMVVGDHYFTGLSARTNGEGASQLSALLHKYGYTASTIDLTTVLHLKTGISYLENNKLLACGEFVFKPQLQSFHLLEVDPAEAYAANAVWINGRVLVAEGFTGTTTIIENHGYQTVTIDVSEFRKLDGGLSCLSLRY